MFHRSAMSDRRRLREIASAIGERTGVEVPATMIDAPRHRVRKERRDYTARELRAMADAAAKGDPPAGSPAQAEIRRAMDTGDFERANALTREVKEKAPALARLARAAEKAERRAKRNAAHIHICKHGFTDMGHDGPCLCSCGAELVMGPTFSVDGNWAWQLADGSFAKFPDPREASHPRAHLLMQRSGREAYRDRHKAETPSEVEHVHQCDRPEDASGHSVCRCACGATCFNTMGEPEWSEP